ncbi:uncharacterized protein LOC105693637 [Athalia rosae]|uniref:uncharacterized protein LOC105693637 n=1 Tax=Athalia rosae TaxID=37344 RepID=UPI002033850F|nr:uncharacterized protein LOC105693637 [Athalia rosae]
MFVKNPWIFPSIFLFFMIELNNAEITVKVSNSESFRLQIFPNTLKNPTNCTLTDPRKSVTIIPMNFESGNPEVISDKVVPLGNDECGVRIFHAEKADTGRWILTLSSETETTTQNFIVTVINQDPPINRSSSAVIGAGYVPILCGPASMLYCELKDPLGNVVPSGQKDRCQASINGVKATDFGVWTCKVAVAGSTTEIFATHTLNVDDPSEEVVISAEKTTFGDSISWQVLRIIPHASWCRAIAPNGESILVSAGLETEKYTTIGTDLSKRRCGLRIKGELPEEYVGTWRLEIQLNSGRTIGGFIRMPEGRIPTLEDETPGQDMQRTIELKVAPGHSFAISCQTQYPAGYCWIRGPNGQQIISMDDLTVGRCSYNVAQAVAAEHDGIWTCNMAHVNGGREQHFVTEVNVLKQLYQAVEPEVKVSRGSKAVIACRALLDYPLRYCRFIRPDNMGLGVTPGMKPDGRYSYEGPGLDTGYCGLAISEVEEVDYGDWTCVSTSHFRTWQTENSDVIHLVEGPNYASAAIIGMSIAAAVVSAIVAVVLFIKWKRREVRTWREPIVRMPTESECSYS